MPLQTSGEHADHVIAFVRKFRGLTLVAIGGRLWMKLGAPAGRLPLEEQVWGDTAVESGLLSGAFTNVLTGETLIPENGRIRLADVYSRFPAALLVSV